ncbi:uncharacterized protein LOC129591470 [Paramacrobiotus metropolitanus]|uniref:uncharacterized protein LOC129591470 n=1 Tax=Paramacrobiotus metropolitanus TaxID=2943436 RepID=UPI0024459DC5|nr:uncharacterized protein LOC129591470 [Paramacrobiotus metropolitanus]
MQIIVALTLCAFLGPPVVADTCEELKAQCAELRRDDDGFIGRMLPPTANPTLWPVTEADLQQYRPFGDAYCRRGVNLGNCIKKLYSHCPEVYNSEKSDYGGWYRPEFQIVTGLLCNTTIGPVKYFRAALHCDGRDHRKFSDCCTLGTAASHEQNENASAAHQNICQHLKVVAERISGADGIEMGSKCGQDAMETVKETYQQLRDVYCPKP